MKALFYLSSDEVVANTARKQVILASDVEK